MPKQEIVSQKTEVATAQSDVIVDLNADLGVASAPEETRPKTDSSVQIAAIIPKKNPKPLF